MKKSLKFKVPSNARASAGRQISNFKGGFTLIELLISLIVLITVGTVTVSILLSSLRGTNKTNVINNIRQNGSYAIIQMSRTIAYAKGFDGVSRDGVTFTSNCVQPSPPFPTPTPTPIQYRYVKVTYFDGGQTVFSCSSSPSTLASNNVSLLDTRSVALTSCSFTCSQEKITDFAIIGINFVLSQKSSGIFAENLFSIPFATSVTIRNARR